MNLYQKDMRFEIPRNADKKVYEELLKDTDKKIKELKKIVRADPDRIIAQADWDDYAEKKKKLKKILEFHKGFKNDVINIQKAKTYPLTQLLKFNNSGFVECPFHGPERTPSAKYYEDRNKLHCFSCGIDADAIDVYMKLYGENFINTVKKLSI